MLYAGRVDLWTGSLFNMSNNDCNDGVWQLPSYYEVYLGQWCVIVVN